MNQYRTYPLSRRTTTLARGKLCATFRHSATIESASSLAISKSLSARERLDAYRAEVAELGLNAQSNLIADGDFTLEGGATAARQLLRLDSPPTALVASSDAEAFGVMQVAREMGVSIPRDLSLVGFDDIPEASYVTPTLTTVRQPMREMGVLAAEMLMSIVEEGQGQMSTVQLPTQLIVRETTGPLSPSP